MKSPPRGIGVAAEGSRIQAQPPFLHRRDVAEEVLAGYRQDALPTQATGWSSGVVRSGQLTMAIEKIIYTPEGQFIAGQQGSCLKVRAMVSEAIGARELIWRLFLRDFRGRYRQSVLGIAWAVLLPFATVAVFVAMNRSGVLTIGDVGVPYPAYALTGLTYWSLFSTGLTACSISLINAGSMLTKINFPKSALVFSAGAQGIVEFLIRAVLTAGVFAWYGITPDWRGIGLGLLCVVPLCLLMFGLGFIVAVVGGIFRDVLNAINAVLAGLLVLTPILYPIRPDSLVAIMNTFNPINHLINVPRDLILYGASPTYTGFWITAILSALLLVTTWRLFFVAQARVLERV